MEEDTEELKKRIKEKEEILRKLKMVKLHRTKVGPIFVIITTKMNQ